MLGRITSLIGKVGGSIGSIDLVSAQDSELVRDIVVNAASEEQARKIPQALHKLKGAEVLHVSDRTFLVHLGGKIEVVAKIPLKTRDDLSMVYTPGVARVCLAIAEKPEKAWNLTIKRNTIAVVSDGTAVLGLGDIGPYGAMPVMEGKAMIFKAFGGLDAFPICLTTKDPDEIVETVVRISPGFGGINLEDISAPRCFEIEEKLQKRLDIPVMHDDQHGTAVVVLAGLINALKIVKKRFSEVKIVISGVGASGVGVSRLLMEAGARNIIGCDRAGAIYKGRKENMNSTKEWYAKHTNPDGVRGPIAGALKGADIFLGLSGPGTVKASELKRMAKDSIVFAMANPTPEVMPEEIPFVKVIATGRSDYPNQINNALAFPGIFRGALDVRASSISTSMLVAAAHAIAGTVDPKALGPDYIIPSIFNTAVAKAVAEAVSIDAKRCGVARRRDHNTADV
ncbi:MAG: NAD-dependent malic enzyme [Elusimicrobia bacterium]|nr:NAD-dependent malic enzyme [Elusimicrobiota bacterium]